MAAAASDVVVYIVVEDAGHSSNDVKNIGAFERLEDARVGAWLALVDAAAKPWAIDFYRDRDHEFAAACGIPDYRIEAWSIPCNSIVDTHCVGWHPTPGGGDRWFDAYLKREHATVVELLSALREDIVADGKVPAVRS